MTDYIEEQKFEIEALQSIYPEEFEEISENPPSFTIHVVSEANCGEEELDILLQITYPTSYPDELPQIEVTSQSEPAELYHEEIIQFLHSQENLGMAMVFTLVTVLKEHLTDLCEGIKNKKEEAIELTRKLKEEEEANRLRGTAVNVANFMQWREMFEREFCDKNRNIPDEQTKSKLTGRQLFERDASLVASDEAFLIESVSETVHIDESLFQDIDDLDLDDLE